MSKYHKLFIQNPNEYRSVLLNGGEMDVYQRIVERGMTDVTSRDVKQLEKRWGLEYSSFVLKRLFVKGYLTRSQRQDATGGIYYIYNLADIDD